MTRHLLVTGDDFGASPEVNTAIAAAHREGILTGASLLITGSAVDDAVERARSLPGLATGLHLALCDARAASPATTIPDLTNGRGSLPTEPARAGLAYWRRARSLRGQLEREIRAQFERYLETGLPLDHVDGHHHIHMHPTIFPILLRCLADYRVGWVRLVREQAHARRSFVLSTELVAAIFAMLAWRHRNSLALAGDLGTPDRIYGLRATGCLDEDFLIGLVGRMSAATVELYTHPSDASTSGRRERAALCAPRLRAAVDAAGYQLSNSRSLAHKRRGPAT